MATVSNGSVTLTHEEWGAYCTDLDKSAERISELEAENARLTKENNELLAGKSANRSRIETTMRDGVPRTKITIAKACFPGKTDKQATAMIAHQFKRIADAGLIREVSPRVWQWVDRSRPDNSTE